MDLIEAIRDRMNERKADIKNYMTRGLAKDYLDYQVQVAKIQAIDQVLGELDDLAKRWVEA